MLGYYVLHVPDSVRAKAFYADVLGWKTGDGDDPTGYHHVEGSSPAGGISGGATKTGVTAYFVVEDATAAANKIRDLGGRSPEPTKSPSGWSATCTDDQGGEFAIYQPSAEYREVEPKPDDGDLFYYVLQVADDERAKHFYGELFGWTFSAGSHPHGWNIEGVVPPGGLLGAGEPGPISLYFQVTDLDAALERVRRAGGTPGEKQSNSSGWHADCVDDQGLRFSLGSLRES
jgi:predicted enzyme related to lactoylglutathione lyase